MQRHSDILKTKNYVALIHEIEKYIICKLQMCKFQHCLYTLKVTNV